MILVIPMVTRTTYLEDTMNRFITHFRNAAQMATVLLLSSCISFIAFEQPQPSFRGNQTSFPEKLQGVYFNPADSGIIEITDSAILNNYFWTIEYPVNKVKPVFKVDLRKFGSTLTPEVTQGVGRLPQNWIETDTIFSLSENNVLRKFKRNHLLNYRELDGYWYFEILSMKADQIKLSIIYVEDPELLENIMPIEKIYDEYGDVAKIIANPNRKQFVQLMESNELIWDVVEATRIDIE